MATTASELKKAVNHAYREVYIKRRFSDGSYDSEWTEISRYVLGGGMGKISFQLDADDFDVGIFVVSNMRLMLDNAQGKFNDVDDSRSIWSGYESRHLTKVKIEAGYRTQDGERIADEIVFNGLIDERTFILEGDADIASATVLSRESIFQFLSVLPGTLSSAVTASTAIAVLCGRSEVTAHINVDVANINPDNDITIDNPSEWANRK